MGAKYISQSRTSRYTFLCTLPFLSHYILAIPLIASWYKFSSMTAQYSIVRIYPTRTAISPLRGCSLVSHIWPLRTCFS
jgi:hypothetical protein